MDQGRVVAGACGTSAAKWELIGEMSGEVRLRHLNANLCLDSNGWGDVYLLDCQSYWKGQSFRWTFWGDYSLFNSMDKDPNLLLTSWPDGGVGMAWKDGAELKDGQRWNFGV